MKTIVHSCPFVPAEWIAAHGLRPSRILPKAAGKAGVRTGVCPFAQAFVEEAAGASDVGAVIATTTCDQMRRSEQIERAARPPFFRFHVPTTWQTVAAHGFYRDELRRLGRFLVGLGGTAPSDAHLADVMADYETRRATLRAARGRLSARRFSEAIARFHQTGEVESDADVPALSAPRGIPLALVGGPLLLDHFGLFERIEAAGGRVVLDATTSGERTLPAPFDRRVLRADPFSTLADAYFGSIPDAFRRPNSALYVWLRERLAERGVRGILFHHYMWCDTWHAEAQRLKEWTDRPVAVMVTGDEENTNGHTTSRIEPLLEILR